MLAHHSAEKCGLFAPRINRLYFNFTLIFMKGKF